MHNGRAAEARLAAGNPGRRRSARDLHGSERSWGCSCPLKRLTPALIIEPCARSAQSRRVLRPRTRAAGHLIDSAFGRARRRRPQRHGQDDAMQCDHRSRSGAWQRKTCGKRNSRAFAERDHRAWHRLRAAGPARVAFAICRRAFAPRRKERTPGSRGRSSASTRCSLDWRIAGVTAAPSSRAVSSRCWRSAARCCSTRACW